MQEVGRAAGIGRIHMAQLEAQIVDHRQRPETRRIAGAEIAVDVVLRETGILERALGQLGMELGERLVVGLARRMLVDADDIGLVLDAHLRLILPSRRKRRSQDGIPFGARGQSRIAAPEPRVLAVSSAIAASEIPEFAEHRFGMLAEPRRRQAEAAPGEPEKLTGIAIVISRPSDGWSTGWKKPVSSR